MAILRAYDDTKGRGSCRSCGADITWLELVSGKRMPFDGEPAYVRTVQVGGRLVGEIDSTVSLSHFATCPQAKDWRKK